eukprot:UN02917
MTQNCECHSNNMCQNNNNSLPSTCTCTSINNSELSLSSPQSPQSPKSLLSRISALTPNNIEFDDNQLTLIVVITRHTILSIFAIIFNPNFLYYFNLFVTKKMGRK